MSGAGGGNCAPNAATATGDKNKHRYVLAVGSQGLRSKIRNEVVGVPVVHANDRNVLVMEPMSELTRQRCDEVGVCVVRLALPQRRTHMLLSHANSWRERSSTCQQRKLPC